MGIQQNTKNYWNAASIVVFLTVGCFIVFYLMSVSMSYCISSVGLKWHTTGFEKKDFQEGSVYRFFLTKNYKAILIAFATIFFHVSVLNIFLRTADYRAEDNEASYKHTCPIDSLNCNTASKVTPLGFFIFICLLVVFLISDFVDGVLMVYESIRNSNRMGILAGTSVLFVSTYSFIVSYIFNTTVGVSNAEILADAAILLFLNDMDERLFETLEKMFPTFLNQIEDLIDKDNPDGEIFLRNSNVDGEIFLRDSNVEVKRVEKETSVNDNLKREISDVENLSENEVVRRQIEHLQIQINTLSTALLDLTSTLQIDGSEVFKGVRKSDMSVLKNPSHEDEFQTRGRLQKVKDQELKDIPISKKKSYKERNQSRSITRGQIHISSIK